MKDLPEQMSHIDADHIAELDVHAIIEAGEKPFDPIMDALAALPTNGALRMLLPFKPSPLIRVMEREGWAHWFERTGGTDWVMWVFRPA